jgi:WD40 repeat protein
LRHDDDASAAPRCCSLSNSERQDCIQMEEDNIRKYILKGHKGSVLCLAHDSISSLLLSGSEDETARLWDLRTSKTALCLLAGGEVTAVAFAPSATLQPLDGPFARNNHV